MRWDIFCQVIDNYGDAGVCWRLCRALAHGNDIRIRLFCDDLKVLDAIAHGNATATGQIIGIDVQPWNQAEHVSDCADVVIESFACNLPDAYIQTMVARQQTSRPAVWMNLEYLTAESFADTMHLMPSPQNNGLTKYFFFPGFSEKTGGVLLGDWYQVTNRPVPESLSPSMKLCRPGALKVSVFQYPTTSIFHWLEQLNEALASAERQADILITTNQNVPEGASLSHLQLIRLPFVPQEDFDWLLAHCDLNLVRGEDSFVRAQWAGKPFIWDIYPQSDQAHEIKHAAFLERYLQGTSSVVRDAAHALMARSPASDWLGYLDLLTEHAQSWEQKLRNSDGLEVKIVNFVKSQEKSR